jgi:hypothetical protein
MLIAYSYSTIGEDNGLAVLQDLAYRRGVLLRAISAHGIVFCSLIPREGRR